MLSGLLGGTFDPVHIGHLRAAIECRERLGLDHLSLMPAADPPLKAAPEVAAVHRLAMVALATAQLDGVLADDRELKRAGRSYTVDTLKDWRRGADAEDSLVFIVGQDVLPQLHRWSRWEQLLDLCHMAILRRPGASPAPDPAVYDWLESHRGDKAALRAAPAGSVVEIDQPALAVSSTDIRAALLAGKNVQYLLPDAVIEYIQQHELYRPGGVPRQDA